jgi:Uma2 family endonuclease
LATVTLEPLDSRPDWGEPEGLYEVIDGRIVEKPMGAYDYWLAGLIYGAIDRYTEAHPTGRALIEMIFDLRPHVDRERRPDVAFLSFERRAGDRGVPLAASWDAIPDLAVEIISRTNRADEVADKLEEYFKAGVRQVWVVFPLHSKIYAYSSTTAVRIFAPGDELDGGEVMPGFRLSIGELFKKAGGAG